MKVPPTASTSANNPQASEQNADAVAKHLLPSMTNLRVFESAGRHLSFSRAASELSLTQSAVSRQIRLLEEFLNLPLFHRVKKRLSLTEAGASYLSEVRSCLSDLKAATLELLAHKGTGGLINLAILPTFGTKWLIPRMAPFWKAHPQIMINFTTRPTAFDFASERLHAAIHFGDRSWPGVVYYRLMGEELAVACAPSLVRDSGLSTAADLARHTLLQHTTRPNAWRDWMSAARLKRVDPMRGPRFEQFSMVIQAAIAGLGVAVLPRFLIDDDVTEGRLVIPLDLTVRSGHAYYLVRPEDRQELPALRAFREWLLDEVRIAFPDSI
jgi:LysR family glycine cleavage system transcriptional activator